MRVRSNRSLRSRRAAPGLLALVLILAACSAGEGGPAPAKDGGNGSQPSPTASGDGTDLDAIAAEARALEAECDYAGARAAWARAATLDPNRPDVVRGVALVDVAAEAAAEADRKIKHGTNLFFVQDHLSAWKAFGEAAALDPNRRDARHRLAEAALEIRRYHQAMDLYGRLIEEDPDDFRARINGAVAAQRAGAFDRCLAYVEDIERIEAITEKSPELRRLLPQVWFVRGVAADESYRTPEAIDALQRASRMDPENIEFRRYLGVVYLKDGKFELASREFKKVLEKQPDHKEALYNLGRSLDRLGRREEAIGWYKRALSRDSTLYLACVYTARCFESLGDRPNLLKSLSYLDTAMKLNPLGHEALHTMQSVYRKLGQADVSKRHNEQFRKIKGYATQLEEQLRDLDRRLLKDPSDVGAHLGAVEILTRHFRWEDAYKRVRTLLNVDSRHADGLHHMARLLHVLGDVRGTYHEALKLIEAAPEDSRGYTMAAVCLHEMKRSADALPHARRAFALDSANFGAVQILVVLLRELGGYEAELKRIMPLFNSLARQVEQKLREAQAEEDRRARELLGDDDSDS